MGYKMIELLSKVEVDPKNSTSSELLRQIGKSKIKVKVKIKERGK
jgi:hypothetical protein